MIQENFNRVVCGSGATAARNRRVRGESRRRREKLHHNALHLDGHFLTCMKHIGVILPYYTLGAYLRLPPTFEDAASCQWVAGAG